MVDPVAEEQVQHAVGVRLADLRQRGAAEECHGAEVPGTSEGASLDHRRCLSNQAKTFFHPSTAACWRYCGRSTAKNACPAFSYVWSSYVFPHSLRACSVLATSSGEGRASSMPNNPRRDRKSTRLNSSH